MDLSCYTDRLQNTSALRFCPVDRSLGSGYGPASSPKDILLRSLSRPSVGRSLRSFRRRLVATRWGRLPSRRRTKTPAVNIIGLTRSIVWATGAAGGLEPTSKLLNQRAPNRHSRVHFFECHDIALPGNATEYV